MSLADLVGSLRGDRGRSAPARRYVKAIMADPPDDVVRELAVAGDGDADHARWELRYARRAIGLLVAQRDALDDRTASEVAAALGDAQRDDTNIAPERLAVAARQLNDRLAAYHAAWSDRTSELGSADRLGRVLLTFARVGADDAEAARHAADVAATIVTDCNAALRDAYGEPKFLTPPGHPDTSLNAPDAPAGKGKAG